MVGIGTESNYFESLPDEILMLILIRIPAQALFCAVMAVCRNWYRIIHTRDFVFAHLHHSTPGLLAHNLDSRGTPFISMTTDGQIDLLNLNFNFEPKFWSSCNGLVLEANPNDTYELMIMNPVTKQCFHLPPFIVRNKHPTESCALAYIPCTGFHKVVRTYQEGVPNIESRIYCAVLTYVVDSSWRQVDTRHLSRADSIQLNRCPIVTEGFVHWAEDWRNNLGLPPNRTYKTREINGYVLTLNMLTETLTRTPVPRCSGEYYHYYKYFSSGGRCLSLLIGRCYLKWEVWEMEPETGEWTRLPDIDLEAHKELIYWYCEEETRPLVKADDGADSCLLDCKLCPAGWVKYREVIVFIAYARITNGGRFGQLRLRVGYNLQTQNTYLFALDYQYHPYLEHKFSLMWIC